MPKLREPPEAKFKHKVWANIVYYQSLYDVDDEKLITFMGISKSTFNRRKKNIGTLTLDEILSVSKALFVPIEKLLTERS